MVEQLGGISGDEEMLNDTKVQTGYKVYSTYSRDRRIVRVESRI